MSDQAVPVSKAGKAYATVDLYDGPRVVSRAVLFQIPHDNQAAGLAIKLVRYDKAKGVFGTVVERADPKKELTLGEEETAVLLAFLKDKAGLVVDGAGTYLKVDDKELGGILADVYERLEKADKNILMPLVKAGKFLPDDVLNVALLKSRQDALAKFEQHLGENATEHTFQKWFEENPWVLGSDCAEILDERKVDVSNIADYITKNYDGHADLIEIKRPSLHFWSDDKDHDNYIPHADLVKAITQAQNYQFELEREMNSVKMMERLGFCPIAKPRCLLIHGRSDGWDQDHFRSQRLLNGGLSSVQVLTYDQVFARARVILGV